VIKITIKGQGAREKLDRLGKALSPEAVDPVIDRVAFETQGRLIRETPKKWFGQVRRGWIVVGLGPARRLVVNENPIMLFLEEGTKDHGPRDIYGPLLPGQRRRKAALFIPLTRAAVNATAGPYQVGTVDQFKLQGVTYWEQRKALFVRTQTVRKGVTRVGTRALVYGIDYVLAKRVRGISARQIVASERPRARDRALAAFKEYLRKVVQNPDAAGPAAQAGPAPPPPP
jgi:hypothetical protein